MCVLFNSEMIVRNTLVAQEAKTQYIELNDLNDFCSILTNTIENSDDFVSKYYQFRFNRLELSEFCDRNNDFIFVKNRIYYSGKDNVQRCRTINRRYSKDVQDIIEIAREKLASNMK